MVKYRITKYNPVYRNADGVFMNDDWTSVHDVGKVLNGEWINQSIYLQVENSYLKAVKIILDLFSCSELKVSELEKYSLPTNTIINIDTDFLQDLYINVKNGNMVSDLKINGLIVLSLRENLWAKLGSNKKKIELEFGYDYYMYFSVPHSLPENIICDIESLNLFVEAML